MTEAERFQVDASGDLTLVACWDSTLWLPQCGRNCCAHHYMFIIISLLCCPFSRDSNTASATISLALYHFNSPADKTHNR